MQYKLYYVYVFYDIKEYILTDSRNPSVLIRLEFPVNLLTFSNFVLFHVRQFD